MITDKISVIIPVVRPESADRCIKSVKKYLPEAEIISAVDVDRIGCPRMVNILTKEATREWILFLGDDTELVYGFDIALNAAVEKLEQGWGVVGLNTEPGNTKAHWMAHRKMLDILPDGVFFSEEYQHCGCDDELFDIASENALWVFAEDALVKHHHPVNKCASDEFYESAYSTDRKSHDKETYYQRKRARKKGGIAIGFPLVDDRVPSPFFTSFACMEKPDQYTLLVPRFPHGPWTGSIADARNSLVQQALDEGCSHLLMLDTDQVYPADTLKKLLSHKKDVCGVRVHRRWMPFDPIFLRGNIGKYKSVSEDEMYSGDLIPVDATGTGCLLFDMDVFLKVAHPWFEFGLNNGKPVGEDINFCSKARQAGIEIFVDTSIEVGHLTTMQVNKSLHQICKKMKSNMS